MEILTPDYFWNAPGGGLCGIFVFAEQEQLAGLDVWSVDGAETPYVLPGISDLREQP